MSEPAPCADHGPDARCIKCCCPDCMAAPCMCTSDDRYLVTLVSREDTMLYLLNHEQWAAFGRALESGEDECAALAIVLDHLNDPETYFLTMRELFHRVRERGFILRDGAGGVGY